MNFNVEYEPKDCFVKPIDERYESLYSIIDKIKDKKVYGQLQTIVESMTKDDSSRRQAFLKFIKISDYKLNQNKPFSWNVSLNQTDKNQDFAFFQDIVIYCILTENTYLIQKWGIDYPFNNQNCFTVYTAFPAEKYHHFFDKLANSLPRNNFGFGIEAKPYFLCLAKGLKKKNGSLF